MSTRRLPPPTRWTLRGPSGHYPDDVVAMLDAVPDVRHVLKTADDAELAEIVRAFDVTITYDKAGQRLDPC